MYDTFPPDSGTGAAEASAETGETLLQAFGQLALVELDDDLIVAASGDPEEVDALAEVPPLQPGQRIQDLFGSSLLEMVLALDERLDASPLLLGRFAASGGKEALLIAQAPAVDGTALLEVLPQAEGQAAVSALASLRRTKQRLADAADDTALLDLAVAELIRMTGFDRVVLHRLFSDGSATIQAEMRNERLPALLDHGYPAGTISEEIKKKLKARGCRYIPDVNYAPRPLQRLARYTERVPNLEGCLLQGVSPDCVKTLHHAGIEALLSWPLVVNGELWGLITCHNRAAVKADYTLLERCGHVIASLTEQLERREQQAAEALSSHIDMSSSLLLERLARRDLVEESLLEATSELLDIFPAEGVAVICGHKISEQGATPPRGELRRLGHCLKRMLTPQEGLFATACLASHFPRAKAYAEEASGMLAIRVSPEPYTMILWFRREEVTRLQRSSFLESSAALLAGTTASSPTARTSGETEAVRFKSRPWSDPMLRWASLVQERASLVFQQHHIEALNKRLREANRHLSQLAETDSLTGLANRRIFDERLALEWARAERDCRSLSLILIDVDFFKRYNDHYGHPAGDSCLTEIAEVLKRSARRVSDLAARIGGEEFALLLPGTGGEGAEMIAERLRQQVLALGIEHADSPLGLVTISLGVASTRPHASTAETRSHLVKTADVALYEAKGGGRNRLCRRQM